MKRRRLKKIRKKRRRRKRCKIRKDVKGERREEAN